MRTLFHYPACLASYSLIVKKNDLLDRTKRSLYLERAYGE
uniref:Uncharacterized protein n=1 Tax=Arundo donax TaxID=35708 RepID=A0A0A8ZDS1_ARUDO